MKVNLLEWEKCCNAVIIEDQFVQNYSDFITVRYTYLI
jgi:hypothetical protein